MIKTLLTALFVGGLLSGSVLVENIMSTNIYFSVQNSEKTATTTEIDTDNSMKTEVMARISEDKKFKAAIICLSQDDFESLGFSLGDSCNVTFSNGYTLEDVPYYNGYYVKKREPVIVAYPGNDTILITLNNVGIWDSFGLNENDKITITLNEAGKYKNIQDVLGQSYSSDRVKYSSDEEFCNFRALSGGNLKDNYLFRGASPVNNSHGRAQYTDALLEKNNISHIIDLADSEEDYNKYIEESDILKKNTSSAEDGFLQYLYMDKTGDAEIDALIDEANALHAENKTEELKSQIYDFPYTKNLYKSNNVILLAVGSNFEADEYKEKVVAGLKFILNTEGNIYIHCTEGKDRTGFVCMLIEALCGATYDEMLSDYMITYQNYYGVSEKTPEKYNAIADLYFDTYVSYLHDTEDKNELKTADYTEDAKEYLRDGGMSDAEIAQLISQLTGKKTIKPLL